MKRVIGLLREQSGASAVEYAIILAVIGGAIAFAAFALGGSVSGAMNGAANCIEDHTAGGCN